MMDFEKIRESLEVQEHETAKITDVEESSVFNFGLFFLGVLFIIGGIVYFAELNYASDWKIFISYSQLWSLSFIFIALTIYKASSNRGILLGSGMVVVAMVLTVPFIFYRSSSGPQNNNKYSIPASEESQNVKLVLENSAGKIAIQGGAEDHVVESFFESNFSFIEPSRVLNQSSQIITLRQPDLWEGIGSYYKTLTVRLTDDKPFDIEVKGNAMNVTADFSDLMISNLDVDVTASDVLLSFGSTTDSTTSAINVMAGSITLMYPSSVGIEVLPQLTLTSIDWEDFKLDQGTNTYKSKNFENSVTKAKVLLTGNLSRVTIVQQ